MPEAEVLYSDVKFKRDKGNTHGNASSPHETTYSEVRILKKQPSTELPDTQQQSESGPRCRVTSERAAVFVLSVLLAASLIALALTLYKNNQTKESLWAVENNLKVNSTNYTILQKMIDECDAEIKNLTERFSAVKPCKPESPKCPEVNRDSCPKCPVGWERHGGKCYNFSTYTATWTRSRDECRCKGGDLVKIESREEQEFLEQKVRDIMTADEDKFWIGLTDSETEGTWLWTDGSALDSLKFWSGTEPDNYAEVHSDGEDCARMGERGKAAHVMCWFDVCCENPHKSICEKPEEP
ncbi:C-type lectin domain family 4 member E-like [Trematomus bernacchii]|uniref:C-type lectin domain family 4 member E-like n=1 Tax=Trematomus bernacchii TaxID=40690 RepID=UPI00146ECF18|nr:C-type lectin domain family 4 member E-like [Trematomus bernacchii]